MFIVHPWLWRTPTVYVYCHPDNVSQNVSVPVYRYVYIHTRVLSFHIRQRHPIISYFAYSSNMLFFLFFLTGLKNFHYTLWTICYIIKKTLINLMNKQRNIVSFIFFFAKFQYSFNTNSYMCTYWAPLLLFFQLFKYILKFFYGFRLYTPLKHPALP